MSGRVLLNPVLFMRKANYLGLAVYMKFLTNEGNVFSYGLNTYVEHAGNALCIVTIYDVQQHFLLPFCNNRIK